jgi:hypothetical protein
MEISTAPIWFYCAWRRDQAESGRAYFLPLRTGPRSHAWRDKDAQNRAIQPCALPARKLGDLCRELAAIDGHGRLSGWFRGIRARGRRSGERYPPQASG